MIIYCIKNKINNKEYIGLTTRKLEERWKQHLYESNRENSWEWNTPLGNAIKKYGKSSFDVSVLEKCSSEKELKEKEIEHISKRKSFVRYGGYNLTEGGDGRLGYTMSEETKRKIGLGRKGKKMSPESIKKCRLAAKKRSVGKTSPMEGRKHTEEAKKKIVSSLIGRKHSDKTKEKMSLSQKGIPKTKEAIENARKGLLAYYANKKLNISK